LKFKIDENLPAECVKLFAEAGFPADTVDQEHLSGSEAVVLFARVFKKSAFWLRSIWTSRTCGLIHPGRMQGL